MVPTQAGLDCAGCGYANDVDAVACGLCGVPLASVRQEHARQRLAPVAPFVRREADLASNCELPICGMPATLAYLLFGALLAPVFTFTPFLQYMGWFLSSLVHEIGHTVAALVVGCSAVPAIRLDGHAATTHGPQARVLAFATWAALGFLAWKLRRRRLARIALACGIVIYPAIAFTEYKEAWHLLGGHLGEIAFATLFFWRALSGGFTQSHSERITYACVAWFFVGSNAWLSGGLIWSQRVQHWYANNGSFGLTNDYIRLARDVLGCRLESVAFAMLVVTLLALPAALGLIWLQNRE